MKIAIASDHAGYELKKDLIETLTNVEFLDMGTNSTESCDYPDFISQVGVKIQNNEAEMGIVICGTGIGASMVANKMKGMRAALCFNEFMAEMSRRHNNANILALGARVIGVDLALAIVNRWLDTPFDGGRHQRRVDKIMGLETGQG